MNTIFKPYMNEPAEGAQGVARISDARKNPGVKNLFNIELTRFPKIVADEPLMSWLLRASDIVSDLVIRDALELSGTSGQSLSDLLILAGRVSHSDLRALERATSLIESGIIYRDFAAIALTYACANFVEFDDALWSLGLHPTDPFGGFKLFELIDDCGLLPHAESLAVRKECLARGVTLGYALMKNGTMSGQLLKVLLECLAAVASGKLEYHDLVLTVISVMRDADTIYGAGDAQMTHEARLVSQVPISTSDRALGNLVMCSGLVSLEDVVFCLEVALADNRSLGAVLADFMLVDPVVLQAARGLAYMVCEKKLSARRSVELIEEVKATGMPLSQLFSDGTSITMMGNTLSPMSSIA
ncbi:MAG: hypothetical protein SGJ27_23005 [Candidatus Melainabacteria bacterium]|nr:hypothetical protein [Candidatus Melainabacteria bacterium]